MKNSAVIVKRNGQSFWGRYHPPSMLEELDIELTERCNNRCVHCCINLKENDLTARRKESSTEKLKGFLEEAASLGCLLVRYTGGEPLLREDFEELYIFTRRLGMGVTIFTNATLITPRLAALFARMPLGSNIEVTVYGMRQSTYEAVTRTPGSYKAAWRGINLLLERRIPFVVKGVYLQGLDSERQEFERWAATIPWMNKPPAYTMFFDLHSRRNVAKNESIKKVRFSPDRAISLLAEDLPTYKEKILRFCSKFCTRIGKKLFPCMTGGCIDAYGYYQICIRLRHPATVYNLAKGSLRDALTVFFPKLRGMLASNSKYLRRCARCVLRALCGQCPAKSWTEYGTLDEPADYYCEVAHVKARYGGLIKAGEKGWKIKGWGKRLKAMSLNAGTYKAQGEGSLCGRRFEREIAGHII